MTFFIISHKCIHTTLEFQAFYLCCAIDIFQFYGRIALGPYTRRETARSHIAPVKGVRDRGTGFCIGNNTSHIGTIHVVFAVNIPNVVGLVHVALEASANTTHVRTFFLESIGIVNRSIVIGTFYLVARSRDAAHIRFGLVCIIAIAFVSDRNSIDRSAVIDIHQDAVRKTHNAAHVREARNAAQILGIFQLAEVLSHNAADGEC